MALPCNVVILNVTFPVVVAPLSVTEKYSCDHKNSQPDASLMKICGILSSSNIVTTPVASLIVALLLGLLNITFTVSFHSYTKSPVVLMRTVVPVVPAKMVIMPPLYT